MMAEVGGGGAGPIDHHIDEDPLSNEDVDEDAEHEVDDLEDSKPRKKRRVIKTSDKKYECQHPDCGKAYSRAEHLYRHQLNRERAPTMKPCMSAQSMLTHL